MREGIEVRHIAQGRNVPMFKTNIMTEPAGPFCGPMVCSMRPMTPENAKKAYDITVKMPNVHGAPVHMGDAAEVGVADVMKPDYGEAVDFYEGELPVFWPCGVTPHAVPDLDIVPLRFSAVVVAAQRVGRVTRKLSPEVLFALPDGFRAAAVYTM